MSKDRIDLPKVREHFEDKQAGDRVDQVLRQLSAQLRDFKAADTQNVGGQPAGSIQDAVRDLFFQPFENDIEGYWNERTGAGTVAYTTNGKAGGKALEATGQVWRAFPENIPFDPDRLYRIRARVRMTSAPTDPAKDRVFIGLEGVAADGVTLVNKAGHNNSGGQHYVVANGKDMGAQTLGEWQDLVGYVKGTAASGENVSTDPQNPAALHEDVRYIRPMFLLNESDGDGVMELDFISVEILTFSDEVDALQTKNAPEEAGANVTETRTSNDVQVGGGRNVAEAGADHTANQSQDLNWLIETGLISAGQMDFDADNEQIRLGAATAPLTGIGVFLGKDGADYEFRAGDPAGDYIHWTGSQLNIIGTLQVGSSVPWSGVNDDDGNRPDDGADVTADNAQDLSWLIATGLISAGNLDLDATNEQIRLGAASAPLTGVGIFLGKDGADYEFRAGDPAGQYLHWTGSRLDFDGRLNITHTGSSHTITGNTVITGSLEADDTILANLILNDGDLDMQGNGWVRLYNGGVQRATLAGVSGGGLSIDGGAVDVPSGGLSWGGGSVIASSDDVLTGSGSHTHPASNITAGTFGAGDYTFPGALDVDGIATVQDLHVVGTAANIRLRDTDSFTDPNDFFMLNTGASTNGMMIRWRDNSAGAWIDLIDFDGPAGTVDFPGAVTMQDTLDVEGQARFATGSGSTPFEINRSSTFNPQALQIWIDDHDLYFDYMQDEDGLAKSIFFRAFDNSGNDLLGTWMQVDFSNPNTFAVTMDGTLDVTGVATFSDDIKASVIENTGNSGSTGVFGGSTAANSTGAYVQAFGNSHATLPGVLRLEAGNVSGGYIQFRANAGEVARFEDGHLALGTTDVEAWGGNYKAIQVGSGGSIMGNTGSDNDLWVIAGAYFDGLWKYQASQPASQITVANGTIVLRVAPSGTADTALTWKNVLEVQNDSVNGLATLGSSVVSNGSGLKIAAVNAGLRLQNTTNGGWAYIEFYNEFATGQYIMGYQDGTGLFRIRHGTTLAAGSDGLTIGTNDEAAFNGGPVAGASLTAYHGASNSVGLRIQSDGAGSTATIQMTDGVGGQARIQRAASSQNILFPDGHVILPSGNRLYLDGGGDTYIDESSANHIRLFRGGSNAFVCFPTTNVSYVHLNPSANNSKDLGNTTTAWRNAHIYGDIIDEQYDDGSGNQHKYAPVIVTTAFDDTIQARVGTLQVVI